MTNESALSAEDVRKDLKSAMDGTIGVRNPKPEVLEAAVKVVREIAELIRAEGGGLNQEAFDEIGNDQPGDLRAWLFELPSFLSKKEREDDGHAVCDLLGPILGEAYIETERAVVWLEAGKKEEAKGQVEKWLGQEPEHVWPHLRGASVMERTGDLKGARRHYELALEKARAAGANQDLRFAYDGLIQFHQEQNEEAQALELGRRMLEEMPEIEEEFRTKQIVNEAPKVGRNDPCSCGSGKKFKKCCGRN